MIEGLALEILGPAALAGLLVLSTHIPLGREVLRRGIIFIDIAIAQLAGTGVIAAQVLGWNAHWWQLQVAGLSAALLGAGLLSWSESLWPELQEAIIGVVFVAMASLAILLLAGHPHGGEELQSLLAGQILWVTPTMLWTTLAVFAPLLTIWLMLSSEQRQRYFYIVFAVAVTTSVQLVGVYLVFASLVIPALATFGLPERKAYITGFGLGLSGYLLGLLASSMFDLPAGSTVVIGLVLCALVVMGVRKRAAAPA